MTALQEENVAQQAQIDELEARMAALEATIANPMQARLLPSAGILLAGLGLVWVAQRDGALSLPKGSGR